MSTPCPGLWSARRRAAPASRARAAESPPASPSPGKRRPGRLLALARQDLPGRPWARRGLAVPSLPRRDRRPPALGSPQPRRHGPRRPARCGLLPLPAPQGRRRASALTRCSAPSGGRGRSSRPSWGQSCWAWRAPPAAVSAAPRALGPSRGAPSGQAPGGAGGGTRKGARVAGSERYGPRQLRRTSAAREAGRGRGRRGRAPAQSGVRPRGGEVRTWPTQPAANRWGGRSRGGGGGTCGQ